MKLIPVLPAPEYIESSGRWQWPLRPPYDNDGRCPYVVTASREWWEYVPSGAKPHPFSEAVLLRDNIWMWTVPSPTPLEAAARKVVEINQNGGIEQLGALNEAIAELKEALK